MLGIGGVKVFKHDQWVEASFENVSQGDYISDGNDTFLVCDMPFKNENGKLEIPCVMPDPEPIVIQLGNNGDQYITMAMDLAGTSLRDFGDDTMMLCEFEDGNTQVYSPRLPKLELEQFCKANIEKYQAFFDQYGERFDELGLIPMDKFW